MARYIATVTDGLEDIAAQELLSFGFVATETLAGAVAFEGPAGGSLEGVTVLRTLNRWARGLDRVGLLLADGEVEGPDDCYELAAGVEYAHLVGARQSFAVRPRRRGSQEFGSMDVGRRVGQAVIDSYRRTTGDRLAVSLDDPDAVLRAEVIGDSFRLWLDASGDLPLYRRGYRRQLHPASLRASLACLMLRLGDWRGEPLLDPMTGIGTIPIEAALYAQGVAPSSFRRHPFAIDRLVADGPLAAAGRVGGEAAALTGETGGRPSPQNGRDADCGDSGVRRYDEPLVADPDHVDVLGVERYEGHVQGAWLNLAAAGRPSGVRIEPGDAEHLEGLIEANHYRLAVLNPPFGRRVGSTKIVRDLYRGFARSAASCGVARIVTLAEGRAAMSEALEEGGYGVVGSRRVLYGELEAHVIIAELS